MITNKPLYWELNILLTWRLMFRVENTLDYDKCAADKLFSVEDTLEYESLNVLLASSLACREHMWQ